MGEHTAVHGPVCVSRWAVSGGPKGGISFGPVEEETLLRSMVDVPLAKLEEDVWMEIWKAGSVSATRYWRSPSTGRWRSGRTIQDGP